MNLDYDIVFGQGKWVFLDWEGIDPGYGIRWVQGEDGSNCALNDGFCVPRGTRLVFHKMQAEPEPILLADKPWESTRLGLYATFLYDQGMYRCWYEASGGFCYAESRDGVHWTKPDLQLMKDSVAGDNRLPFGIHGHGVFVDEHAPANERYKMVGCYWTADCRAVVGAVSADGLNWTRLDDFILSPQHADTKNVCRYDARTGKYVLYTRQRGGRSQRRGVNRAVSSDFSSFESSVPVFTSTPNDPCDWDIYCSGYSQWPGANHAHLMRLSMYRHTTDAMELHLGVSRDEHIWHRPLGQEPWLLPVSSGCETIDTIYAADGIVPIGEKEWATYICTSKLLHNQEAGEADPYDGGFYRVPMRADGFSSIQAEGHGEFWTIPFLLESDTISLNMKTRAGGYICCELMEAALGDVGTAVAATKPIDGYTMNESVPLSGDCVCAPLTWSRGKALAELRGKPVRLHFKCFKSDLYSIQF